jgi:hypothetical protein
VNTQWTVNYGSVVRQAWVGCSWLEFQFSRCYWIIGSQFFQVMDPIKNAEHFKYSINQWPTWTTFFFASRLIPRQCLGPERKRSLSLVEIRCRAWTSALVWLWQCSESELQRHQQHRAVTGDYSCHDRHPVFIPAFTQYHFIWNEWLTSSSR